MHIGHDEVVGGEDDAGLCLVEIERLREEDAPFVAVAGFGAAEIGLGERDAAADQPAGQAVQHEQVGAVGKGAVRRVAAGFVEDDAGIFAFQQQFTVKVIEDHAEKAQGAAQGAFEGVSVDQRVAEQGEAAGFHAVAVHAEKFVVQRLRDAVPELAVMRGGDAGLRRAEQFRRNPGLAQQRLGIKAAFADADQGFFDEAD